MSREATNWAWVQHVNPPAAKLVLLALADHADAAGTCWPGIDVLAGRCSMSERNITRLIRVLEQEGLLSVESRREKGRQNTNSYSLNSGLDKHAKITDTARQDVRQKTRQIDTRKAAQSTQIQPDNLSGSTARQDVSPTARQPVRQYSLTNSTFSESHSLSREPKVKNNTPLPPKKLNGEKYTFRFDEFWTAYPKKAGKKPSRSKWASKRLDDIADKIIADVKLRAATDAKWLDGYIPNPLTFLTQERWEDEISQPRQTGPIPAQEARRRHEARIAARITEQSAGDGGRTYDQNGAECPALPEKHAFSKTEIF